MATKLQELLEELKELKRFYGEVDEDGDFDLRESSRGDLIRDFELEELITKYTETTPTYKPGDKVKVIANINNHGFAIGQYVTLTVFDDMDKDWYCNNKYYLSEEEFEPINK